MVLRAGFILQRGSPRDCDTGMTENCQQQNTIQFKTTIPKEIRSLLCVGKHPEIVCVHIYRGTSGRVLGDQMTCGSVYKHSYYHNNDVHTQEQTLGFIPLLLCLCPSPRAVCRVHRRLSRFATVGREEKTELIFWTVTFSRSRSSTACMHSPWAGQGRPLSAPPATAFEGCKELSDLVEVIGYYHRYHSLLISKSATICGQ